MGRGCPPPQPTRTSGEASWAPPAGSGAEPQPKTNFVHFVAARRTLIAIITGRMPRSGKLPVLDLLAGQKSGFSPRRGDSLHRFRSNFAGPTGNWVRLALQNFTSIGTDGSECGGMRPPKYQKFPLFWQGRLLWPISNFLGAFIRLTILR